MANETSNNSSQAFFPFDMGNGLGVPFDGNTAIPLVVPQFNTVNKIVAELQTTLRADNLILNSYGGFILDSNGNILVQS
jgi:hypothetical protein